MAGDVHTAHSPDTFYAPSGRDTSEVFARKQRILAEAPLLYEALNAVHDMVLILNEQRQIVMANDAALRLLKATIHDLLQKRPGEVVECIWSQVGPDGCGTGPHCITCGAVDAILESQEKNIHVVRECRIRIAGSTDPGSLDLRVAATPVIVQGDRFIVLAIEDISKPKRLEVLQRVFFHDVLNTAGCISGCAAYLLEKPQSFSETCDLLVQLSDELVEEIKAQRDLLLAESGDLDVQIDIVLTQAILDELRVRYLKNPVAEERRIEIGPSWKGMIWTDRRLLLRVYGNMLKNGLEATARGQTVTISCLDRGEDVEFAVHNPGVIPEEVQLQVFQRSFSTKGQTGRGIGTYSMKLLGERYLGGKVGFVSRAPEGTTFTLTIGKKRA